MEINIMSNEDIISYRSDLWSLCWRNNGRSLERWWWLPSVWVVDFRCFLIFYVLSFRYPGRKIPVLKIDESAGHFAEMGIARRVFALFAHRFNSNSNVLSLVWDNIMKIFNEFNWWSIRNINVWHKHQWADQLTLIKELIWKILWQAIGIMINLSTIIDLPDLPLPYGYYLGPLPPFFCNIFPFLNHLPEHFSKSELVCSCLFFCIFLFRTHLTSVTHSC